MQAAIECFAARGFAATSIQDIATEAGISKGIIYHYFASKDEIMRRIVNRALDDLGRSYDDIPLVYASVHQQIRAFMQTMVTYVAAHPRETAIFVQERRLFTSSFEDLAARSDQVVMQLEDLLRNGTLDGSIRELASPHAMSLGLIGMATWLYQWTAQTPYTPDQIADTYADVVLEGLCIDRSSQPATQTTLPYTHDDNDWQDNGSPARQATPTRETLTRAAIQEFVSRGYAGTPINVIAKNAGVTTGAVYSQFSGKKAILHLIMSRFLNRLSRTMDRALIERLPLPDVTARFISAIFGEVGDHQAEMTIFLQEFRHLASEEFKDLRMKCNDIIAKIGAVLAAGIEEKQFRDNVIPDVTAIGVLGMCTFPFQWKAPAEVLPPETATMFAEVILAGLAPS
ncbi:TetR/AcrR family transcriptional regulator [Mycolicibacterium sp. CBMA 226]|uniref:TetR/AcrR family transcriptional regulator n=1 Tax=Mycolicibacterium sp. CBMA 226 TaxID=2606611 RepID=UPI0012DD9C2B|nr:TetR/AcrR family transcriptional regulator [Mycolicibacterium sp. CBMA 226]